MPGQNPRHPPAAACQATVMTPAIAARARQLAAQAEHRHAVAEFRARHAADQQARINALLLEAIAALASLLGEPAPQARPQPAASDRAVGTAAASAPRAHRNPPQGCVPPCRTRPDPRRPGGAGLELGAWTGASCAGSPTVTPAQC
jgi:hypothetical protein